MERLWRTVKYEEVYLKTHQSVTEARKRIGAYLDFYNHERLGYWTPGEMFQEEQQRSCLQDQEVVLLSGIKTSPLVAEDSLNLASLLAK